MVLTHAVASHDLTAAEYRSIFGLWKSDNATGAEHSARRAAHTRRRHEAGDLKPIRSYGTTTEQYSAAHARVVAQRRARGVSEPVSAVAGRMREDEEYRARWYAARGLPYLTPEQRAEIRALRASTSASRLASMFGISRGQVDRLCGHGQSNRRLPVEVSERIAQRNTEIRARKGVESATALAERYGLTPTTIRAIWRAPEANRDH